MAATVQKDFDRNTFIISAVYAASPERVWGLWADPRQLERWWGPPSHPATVTDHDFVAGGTVAYFMTGPDGEKYHGGWRILRVEAPHLLEFEDYFADDSGAANQEMPISRSTVSIEASTPQRARMTITTRYENADAMAKVLEMGMEEGILQALAQVDELLAETP